jgi:hypothetical protein
MTRRTITAGLFSASALAAMSAALASPLVAGDEADLVESKNRRFFV